MIPQKPCNTWITVSCGLYATTRVPLTLFYSSKNVNSDILGIFLLQSQISRSPLEPLFLLLTMEFHSWHQIPSLLRLPCVPCSCKVGDFSPEPDSPSLPALSLMNKQFYFRFPAVCMDFMSP